MSDSAFAQKAATALGLGGVAVFVVGQSLTGISFQVSMLLSAVGLMSLVFREVAREQPLMLAAAVGSIAYAVSLFCAVPIPALFAPVMVFVFAYRARLRSRASLKEVGLGLLVGATAILALVLWWSNRTEITFWSFIPVSVSPDMPAVAIIALCVTGAMFNATWEELLWRRVLVGPFERLPRGGYWVGSIVLSVGFGLAHFHSIPNGWAGALGTSLFAVLAHWLCRRHAGGLLAAIVAHFLADLCLLLLISGW